MCGPNWSNYQSFLWLKYYCPFVLQLTKPASFNFIIKVLLPKLNMADPKVVI